MYLIRTQYPFPPGANPILHNLNFNFSLSLYTYRCYSPLYLWSDFVLKTILLSPPLRATAPLSCSSGTPVLKILILLFIWFLFHHDCAFFFLFFFKKERKSTFHFALAWALRVVECPQPPDVHILLFSIGIEVEIERESRHSFI